ncbi:hypothetical protein [Pseudomonas huanghezhanensis]|uniref:hypothetical protein n=1 Tax=Pseudomonas huanghezhanensis TaxID=3002903 RepID=UPI0022866415|nr:hypothetical protein [Pseudomonas sp. BSw22131]
MRKFCTYLGFALAACLSCFSISVLAEPISHACRSVAAMADLPSVALRRMELTLVAWRTGSSPNDDPLKSNLRASSNHFVMTTAKAMPESVGLAPC